MSFDAKLHRLIAVADVAAEVAADWVQAQEIPAAVLAADPGGLYDRTTSGAQGFECAVFWLDSNGDVVHDAVDVSLRPTCLWTCGAAGAESVADGDRVTWAAEAKAAAPGEISSFEDSRPSRTWLKVMAATVPGGTSYLAIYTRSTP